MGNFYTGRSAERVGPVVRGGGRVEFLSLFMDASSRLNVEIYRNISESLKTALC